MENGMKIGNANEEQLINQVVRSLTNRLSVTSWTLVVPPGFGESYVPKQIVKRLQEHESQPRVAFVRADRVQRKYDLLLHLHRQWVDEAQRDEVPDFISRPDADVGSVLNQLGRDARKKILVVSRFHKILDWADETILQDLRDAEQVEDIQTAVVSIYPLSWIKDKWRKKGAALLASDYGVEHADRMSEPLEVGEVFEVFKTYEDAPVPGDLIKSAVGWTGGYPELINAVIHDWHTRGRPKLSADVEKGLFQAAVSKVRRLAQELDEEDVNRFRELVTRVHLHRASQNELYQLRRVHPWGEILVDDDGLRADAVGEACLNLHMEDAVRSAATYDAAAAQFDTTLTLYHHRQFEQALQILGKTPSPNDRLEVLVLRNHAKIMDAIYNRGVDADWSTVRSTVKEATKLLDRASLRQRDVARLRGRLEELENLAVAAFRVSASSSRRIIDLLSGVAEDDKVTDHRTALTLLLLQLECAKAARGNSDSVRRVLSMPEQVFRVWAWWRLKVNYYRTPANADPTWEAADREWSRRQESPLTRSEEGAAFPNTMSFVHFCMARMLEDDEPGENALARDFGDLRKQMFVFEWRNDEAHSLSTFSAKSRQKYLDLAERWLDCLCACCPEGAVNRSGLLHAVEPLPVLQDGGLVWP
jgi:hypothetical protein